MTDNKVIPIRPLVPMGRSEPKLPVFSPRDLAIRRRNRILAYQEQRRRNRFTLPWPVAAAGGFIFAHILMAIR